MKISDSEVAGVHRVDPKDAKPDYDRSNPIMKLLPVVEGVALAADREHYLADSLQFLFPIASLQFYGPSGDQWEVSDPRQQDDRNDFQKQNLKGFTLGGTEIVRGYATVGDWIGPFLGISYMPEPGSPLLGVDGTYRNRTVLLHLKVGDTAVPQPLQVAFDEELQRFHIELWSLDRPELLKHLGQKGGRAVDRTLFARPDLIHGSYEQLHGRTFDVARKTAAGTGGGVEMLDYAPDHSMHPVRPLKLEIAWGSEDGSRWDSRHGENHRYEFAMSLRGWKNYLAIGKSRNPHGGLKGLEYRNLYSNYFGHEGKRRRIFGENIVPELGRDLPEWSFDADGRKPPELAREPFMAVDYMDLHILEPNSIIGIHRHRDNQEAFMVLEGKALMVTGDWAEAPERERAFEIRTMSAGDLTLIKGGQMHSLVNCLDENVPLFMLGGYD